MRASVHTRERRKWARERQARHLHWLVRSSGSIDHDPRRFPPRGGSLVVSSACFLPWHLRVFSARPRLVTHATQCRWTVPRRRVNNPERLMRSTQSCWKRGLPVGRDKFAKSWICKLIFFLFHYNCVTLSIITHKNITTNVWLAKF